MTKEPKYMALKEAYWEQNHQSWEKTDSRYGMKPFTGYELTEVNENTDNVVLHNKIKQRNSYFNKDNVYKVTPEENPELFL